MLLTLAILAVGVAVIEAVILAALLFNFVEI